MGAMGENEILGRSIYFRHDNDIDRWKAEIVKIINTNRGRGMHVAEINLGFSRREFVLMSYFPDDDILSLDFNGTIHPVRAFEYPLDGYSLEEENYIGRGSINLYE